MRHTFPLTHTPSSLRGVALAAAIFATLGGCGGKEPSNTSAVSSDTSGTTSEVNAAVPEPIPTLPPSNTQWTPEALENLLAPSRSTPM